MSNFTPSGSIGSPLALTWRYAGVMTATLCPGRCSSTGRAPQTSAKPPVFANGATSLLAKTMFKRHPSLVPCFVATSGRMRGYSPRPEPRPVAFCRLKVNLQSAQAVPTV